MCISCFVYLSHGHLCYLYSLAIGYNIPLNMGFQIPLQIPAFDSLNTHPEMELLDQMVILFLIF